MKKIIWLLLISLVVNVAQAAQGVDKLIIFCSGGLRSTVLAIADQYQKQTGVLLDIKEAPSMGSTYSSIPQRMARHEEVDVLVMVASAIAPLQAKHWVVNESNTSIANSYIGMAVKKGRVIPSIATVKELRDTLLAAKRVVFTSVINNRENCHNCGIYAN